MTNHDAPMLPRRRTDYSAIVDRPPLRLPGRARLVLWPIVNLEVWDISRPMPRQVLPAPTGVSLLPDVPHWSWHEYGMRVGVWRFFELVRARGIKPTRAINAFDRLYAEGEHRGKVMAVAIHPYISGQPHRIKYLEAIYDYAAKFDGVLHWTGEQILEWYLKSRK